LTIHNLFVGLRPEAPNLRGSRRWITSGVIQLRIPS
jgi:hypothetical protein